MSGHIDQAPNLGATNRVEQNGRRVRQNNVSVIRVRKLAILQVQDHTNKMRHNIYLQRNGHLHLQRQLFYDHTNSKISVTEDSML